MCSSQSPAVGVYRVCVCVSCRGQLRGNPMERALCLGLQRSERTSVERSPNERQNTDATKGGGEFSREKPSTRPFGLVNRENMAYALGPARCQRQSPIVRLLSQRETRTGGQEALSARRRRGSAARDAVRQM
ncbi:hypothetical protein DPX16_21948 [Anabarilius grahami]|uniref:Uncharacterized protein n=1 Tax=Anabarilius grahami TaxID=495550 RepID=A0A3N0XNC0_ANAGA|nr:hypothetical protein DPX16_21948 [Anabarilius grahami]